MKLKKRTAILVLAAVVTLLAAGTAIALIARRPVLKLAARGDVIALWRAQGVDQALWRALGVKIQWMNYGSDPQESYRLVQEDLDKPARALPDAYLGLGLESRQIAALAAQGALLEIDPAQTPNLRQVMDSDTSRVPEMQIAGGLYSFPALRENLASVYPQKAWINAKWLAAAKLPLPSTPAQLHAALRAFQTLDGNGNGIADEVPLGAAYAGAGYSTLGFLVEPFLTTDYDLSESNYLNIKDGKVYTGATAPQFKEALAWLRALYAEGLMDKTVFSQGAAALKESAGDGEKYGVLLTRDLAALLGEERAAAYAPLPPLTLNGHSATLVRRAAVKTGGFLIPARTSPARQKRALALGDAMLGPSGARLVNCEGSEAVYSALRGEVPCWEILPDELTQTWYAPVGERCLANALPALTLAPERAAALSRDDAYAKVIRRMAEYTQAFVTGAKSLDTQWDAYLAALDAAGLQKILQYTQEAYDQDRGQG